MGTRIYGVCESEALNTLSRDVGREKLDILLSVHGGRLYGTLVRLTLRHDVASELFQELFVKVGGSATFETASDPTAYAFRVAINLAMDWRRRRRREPVVVEGALEMASTELPPLAQLIHAEEIEGLLDALSGVSEASREVFVLRMIEGEAYTVIAAKTGKTRHQVGACVMPRCNNFGG